MSLPEQHSISHHAQLFKAVSEEVRLRILGLLMHGELCVCDLMEILQIPQSTASRHLAYLKNSGWITGRRKGKWMYYCLAEEIEAHCIKAQIIKYISELQPIIEDRDRLEKYLEKKNKQNTCD